MLHMFFRRFVVLRFVILPFVIHHLNFCLFVFRRSVSRRFVAQSSADMPIDLISTGM
jgi:hypothetical protein